MIDNRNKHGNRKQEKSNKKLLFIIIFATILYGIHYKVYGAWTEADQMKYEERLQQGQAQGLEMEKELAKIQADSLREQE